MEVNIVDNLGTTPSVDPTLSRHAGQEEVVSPTTLAMLELQETFGSAIYETLEEMGMALSGKLREQQNHASAERLERRQQALLSLVKRIQEDNGGKQHFPAASTSDSPELDRTKRIMASAVALCADGLSKQKKRALKAQLDVLMAEKGWELAFFSIVELGTANKMTLASLTRLMQQAIDEDETPLSQWFQRIADWPDRRERVRVLLRTMAFELTACAEVSQQRRLAAVLTRLRRLLLFFGLEKECKREEQICQLPKGSLLPLLLTITGESWLFSDWLLARLTPLVASRRMLNRLLHHLDVQFTLMPDACFNDADQREQILETIRELKGYQVLP